MLKAMITPHYYRASSSRCLLSPQSKCPNCIGRAPKFRCTTYGLFKRLPGCAYGLKTFQESSLPISGRRVNASLGTHVLLVHASFRARSQSCSQIVLLSGVAPTFLPISLGVLDELCHIHLICLRAVRSLAAKLQKEYDQENRLIGKEKTAKA